MQRVELLRAKRVELLQVENKTLFIQDCATNETSELCQTFSL